MSLAIRLEILYLPDQDVFTYDMALTRNYTVDEIVLEWEEEGYKVLTVSDLENGTLIYDAIDI